MKDIAFFLTVVSSPEEMNNQKKLVNKIRTKVRFSEVDSMHIVWHGNYIKYLEDGREGFGNAFGLGYYDVYKYGLMTPIVKLEIEYKSVIRYGEEIIIETEYVPTKAAKINFRYKIYNAETNKLSLTAQSTQVFVNKDGDLQITNPDFYLEWQKKWGIIL